MINRKIPWTSQPQYPVEIDRSNPLGAKVVYASTLAGGYAYDSVARKLGVNTAAVPVATPRGTALKFNGSSSLITLPTTDLVSGYPLTVSCWFYKPSSVSRVIYSFNGSAFHAIAGFFSSGHLGVSADSSGLYYLPNASIPAGWNHLTIVFYSGSYNLYLNGVAQTLTGGGNNWTQPAAGNNAIGARLGGASLAYFSEAIQDLIVFNGKLSADEARQVYLNPYQIFQPQNRRLWVPGAGGTDTPVNPGVGSLAITGYVPTIGQTANQAVAPDVGNIVITGYAPTISQPQAVNPGVGSLTITGYAPTVTQNVDVPVNPGVGAIAITGYAPTVAQTANQSVLPATGTIAITGYSPTVSQSANQAVTPDVGTITITGYAPIVQQAPASQNITPDVGTITITGYAPTVEQSSPLRLGGFEYGSKVYIKRNKKIYIFDSVEEADSYLEAEAKVEEIVQQSNKTSRLARKRAREKAFKSLAIEPVDTVDIPALKTLVAQLQTDFELPKLIAQQDWQRVVEIYNQAMEMQDEEDLLLIL